MPKQTMCPECYLMGGHEVALNPQRPGSQFSCPNGHTWDDREVLQNRIDLAKMKRAQVEGTNKEPDPDEEAKKVAARQKPTGNEVVISMVDYQRIAEKVGDFPDGATLYGKIHSMKMDMANLQQQLSELQNRTSPVNPGEQPGAPGVPSLAQGGDMEMSIIIPEQHVGPIKDMAESTNTSVVGYVNAVIENGLNSGWFY